MFKVERNLSVEVFKVRSEKLDFVELCVIPNLHKANIHEEVKEVSVLVAGVIL